MPPSTIIPSIPLSELPLRPSTLSLLTQRGFVSTRELEESRSSGGGMANLAAELDVNLQTAANLMREVQGCLTDESPQIMTAGDLLQDQTYQRNHIVTFAKEVDQLLGGGIALGQVTEISGLPGSGKTQLAMQLCVLCRLPTIFGGVEGKAIYIDAEGSFSPERCLDMSEALIQHVQSTAQRRNVTDTSSFLTTEQILDSINVFRVHDETAQQATLYGLPKFLSQPNQELPVKLIVIDSIAFHYRAITPTSSKYYLQRTKQLTSLAGFLSDLARDHDLAVVCINQMTTKLNNQKSTTSLIPALGESWAHAVTTRLLLKQQQQYSHQESSDLRTCTLIKSPHRPAGTAQFRVLQQGIRGLQSSRKDHGGKSQIDHNKRLRTH